MHARVSYDAKTAFECCRFC